MSRTRFSLETLWIVLLVPGTLAAIAGDRLSIFALRDAGLVVVFAAAVVFGLDMIVKRRADIGTRYSSHVNPAFHVFRGWPAVAWGISIGLFAGAFVGYAMIEMTGWSAAKDFFRERPGILIALGGVMVTAWGVGSAGRATYRLHSTETPATRWGDRIAGMLAIPLGLCIIAVALLRMFAPSVLDALKASALDSLIGWTTR